MGCCMGGSRADNDNGQDMSDIVSPVPTAPDGVPIGKDGSHGGTIPYYGTPGGSMTGGNPRGGPYVGATVHSLGTNYTPTKISSDYIKQMKSDKLSALSDHFESGNDPGKVHLDNNNFYAYGKNQMNSGTGTVNTFLKFEKVNDPEAYTKLMAAGGGTISGQQSVDFQNAWKELGSKSSFSDDQDAFMKTNFYDKAAKKLENVGVNVDGLSTGAKQLIWSTSAMVGPDSSVMVNAIKGMDKSNMSSSDFINAVSDYKINNVNSIYRSSNSAVRSAVAHRMAMERVAALGNN